MTNAVTALQKGIDTMAKELPSEIVFTTDVPVYIVVRRDGTNWRIGAPRNDPLSRHLGDRRHQRSWRAVI
ncbi:MAG TPA: hypothetical protein VJX94_28290 [Stellaceae bacterium]|nr:hypothetical protein [Stellaceae bacterium]